MCLWSFAGEQQFESLFPFMPLTHEQIKSIRDVGSSYSDSQMIYNDGTGSLAAMLQNYKALEAEKA